jgi:hypothetical protein
MSLTRDIAKEKQMKIAVAGSEAKSTKSAESSLQQFVIRTMQWSIALGHSSDVPVRFFMSDAIANAERGAHPGVKAEDLEHYFSSWPVIVHMFGLPVMATMREFYEVLAEIALAMGEDFTWVDLETVLEHVLLTAPTNSTLEKLVGFTREALTLAA